MAQPNTPDQLQQPSMPDALRKHKGMRSFLAAITLAAGGSGVAYRLTHEGGNGASKDVVATSTTQSVEANHAFEAVVNKVMHPQKGDTFSVAHGIFKLKPGAKVSDGRGNETVLTKLIDGIQSPAWTPEDNTLCFLQEKGNVVCFDLSGNENFIEAVADNGNGLQEVPVTSFTPDNALEATVTQVEGDGFAYANVAGHDQYVAGRPTTEGDTLSNLPS